MTNKNLGFGLMRLPMQADGTVDIAACCEMTDRFLAAGGTYFDTAPRESLRRELSCNGGFWRDVVRTAAKLYRKENSGKEPPQIF